MISIVNIVESQSTSTLHTTDVPSGTQADDLLIWSQTLQSATAITPPTDPSDWGTIGSGSGTALSGLVLYRWADSSEPASYSNELGSSGKSCALMLALRGVDRTTPFDVATPSPATNFTLATEPISLPGITTVTDQAWVCSIPMCTVSTGLTIDFTGTNMDSLDEWLWTNAGGANCGQAFMHEVQATAGSFSPTVTTATDPARHIGITFALRPAAGGAPSESNKFFHFV